MVLSKFQKKIISQLIHKEIKDIKEFFIKNCTDIITHPNFEDIAVIYDRIIEYLILMQLLEKKELIYIVKDIYEDTILKGSFEITEFYPNYDKNKKFENEEETFLNYKLNDLIIGIELLINNNKDKDIYATPELIKFKKDGYKTEEERNIKWSKWSPIAVAVITVFLSVIFNYFIYTNSRKVTIENTRAFKDTMNVILVDTTKTIKNLNDTIKQK